MAAPPLVVPVGGFLRLIWNHQGQNSLNVMGLFVQAGGVFNQSSADAIANVVHAQAVSANIAGQLHTSTSLTGVGIRDLRAANQPEYLGAFAAVVGTDNTEPLPLSTSLVITLRTALAGKSFRGRTFLPFDGGGSWDGAAKAYTSLAKNAGEAFINGIRSGLGSAVGFSNIFGLAVVSRGTDQHAPQANTVISVQCRNQINGTQRRRLPARR